MTKHTCHPVDPSEAKLTAERVAQAVTAGLDDNARVGVYGDQRGAPEPMGPRRRQTPVLQARRGELPTSVVRGDEELVSADD